MNAVIKTFVVGLSLGCVSAAVLSIYFPAVDLQREPSLISVQPNGGAVENFFVNLPDDRILNSSPEATHRGGLSFEEAFDHYNSNAQAEIFKVRNENGKVIGIGSRISSSKEATGGFAEWTLHFPARGSMYVKMHLNPSPDGIRGGELITGTRDFNNLSGSITEQVITFASQKPSMGVRIHLQAVLIRSLGDSELNM